MCCFMHVLSDMQIENICSVGIFVGLVSIQNVISPNFDLALTSF